MASPAAIVGFVLGASGMKSIAELGLLCCLLMKVSFIINPCKDGIDLGKVSTACEILISTDTKVPGLISAQKS